MNYDLNQPVAPTNPACMLRDSTTGVASRAGQSNHRMKTSLVLGIKHGHILALLSSTRDFEPQQVLCGLPGHKSTLHIRSLRWLLLTAICHCHLSTASFRPTPRVPSSPLRHGLPADDSLSTVISIPQAKQIRCTAEPPPRKTGN